MSGGSRWRLTRASSARASSAPCRAATWAACTRRSLTRLFPRKLIERVVDGVERVQRDHQPRVHKGEPDRNRVDDEAEGKPRQHRSGPRALDLGSKQVRMRERPRHQALEGDGHEGHDHRIERGRDRAVLSRVQVAAEKRGRVGEQHHREQEDQVDELDRAVHGSQVSEDRVVVHPDDTHREEAGDVGDELRPLSENLGQQLSGVHPGKLLAKVLGQWPQLVTYVASFLTVGVVWVNHHTIFRNLRSVDRTIQFINLVLLLTVVLLPYPTALLGRYLNSGQNGSVAAAFYAVVMTLMAIAFQCLVAWALTHPKLLRPEIQGARPGSVLPRFALGLVIYAVSIGLAFVNTWLVVALYAFNAVYYAFNQLSWEEARK